MDSTNSFRFAAFNIWGDFFGNPTHERDLDVSDHSPLVFDFDLR